MIYILVKARAAGKAAGSVVRAGLKVSGVRGGAATGFAPIWHREIQDIMVLKNNRGVEENRVRHLDYGIQLNKLFWGRILQNKKISLFCPSIVPGLYEAFFADQEEFERLYTKYEEDTSIDRITVDGSDLGLLLAGERAGTSRIYIQNVDHCNVYGPFIPSVAPVRQSNLCLEIALPTKPLVAPDSTEGEIALCTLSAFNLGVVKTLEDFLRTSRVIVRTLDALLSYQEYQLKPAERGAMLRRSLGVGVVNFAYSLAKLNYRYDSQEARDHTHRIFERMQYSLMMASTELAEELGACEGWNETKLSKGILPIDNYKETVDELTSVELECDWEYLRHRIKTYGMRNSTLSALMPSETSSQILNATNGIEPPRGLVSVKASKDGRIRQVVPEIETIGHQYDLAWNMESNLGYIKICGIMQKFVDQAISANTNYDPTRYPGNKVPAKRVLKEMAEAYRYGVKTLYYHNTRKQVTDAMEIEEADEDCEGGGCKI